MTTNIEEENKSDGWFLTITYLNDEYIPFYLNVIWQGPMSPAYFALNETVGGHTRSIHMVHSIPIIYEDIIHLSKFYRVLRWKTAPLFGKPWS
jgi:hypothetical protein